MRTVIAAIGLAAVVLLTGTAHATLVVTDGVVEAFNADTFASFRGDGFSVGVSLPEPSWSISGSASFSFGSCFPVPPRGSLACDGASSVQVDGASCTTPFSLHPCGRVTLI